MLAPLTGLLALAALSMLAVLVFVRRALSRQQSQIEELTDFVNALESRLNVAEPAPTVPLQPPELPPTVQAPPADA